MPRMDMRVRERETAVPTGWMVKGITTPIYSLKFQYHKLFERVKTLEMISFTLFKCSFFLRQSSSIGFCLRLDSLS